MELKTARGRLFIVLLILLALPMLQQYFPVEDEGRLYGFSAAHHHVPFTWGGWWDGSFQSNENDFLNDSMGFRTDLVHINNELDFVLFHKLNAHGTVAGINNYLFEKVYINDYCGKTYAGDTLVLRKLKQLKRIQDTLTHLGKTLLLVYAPSKAYYYPQYIPADMQCPGSTHSNYRSFLHTGDSLGINQLDFNGWFMQMKGSRDLLFSRPGTHWTEYGAMIAVDSITRYINKARGITMTHPMWKKVNHTTVPFDQEWDLEAASNLMLPLSHDTFSHPEVEYGTDSAKAKPAIIIIGDSFVWTIVGNKMLSNISNNWAFWYYFRTGYDQNVIEGREKEIDINNYNWMKQILDKDVIILLYTTSNLPELGDGFIEQSYRYFQFDRR